MLPTHNNIIQLIASYTVNGEHYCVVICAYVYKPDFIAQWFQPVLHDWCNKGRGMCYPFCDMMHIK